LPILEEPLEGLFQEYLTSWVPTEEGRAHFALLSEQKARGNANLHAALEAREEARDTTDLVLRTLLPYADSDQAREAGSWVFIDSAIQGTLRTWFESKGWVAPSEWGSTTDAILRFVERVTRASEAGKATQLEDEVTRLAKLIPTHAFHGGMLSPILFAQSDLFLPMHRRLRTVVNHFLESDFGRDLEDYPDLNRGARYLLQVLAPVFGEHPAEPPPADLLVGFGYWLHTVRNYGFGRTRHWIARAATQVQYETWLREGVLGFTAPVPNRASLKKGEIRDLGAGKWEGLEDADVGAALKELFERVSEGDRIVVVDDPDRVLAVGRVESPYEYRDVEGMAHCVGVRWAEGPPRVLGKRAGRLPSGRLAPISEERFTALNELPEASIEGAGGLFRRESFRLLEGLHGDPTREYYDRHKEAIQAHVEAPLQTLLSLVGEELPATMREVLETEKRLFSRIPKNDWGRGGAWDFYWGAFYPIGGRRIEAPQLFVWVNREGLEWGFYIGDYGADHTKRFLRNVERPGVIPRLTELLGGTDFVFGAERDPDGSYVEGTVLRSFDEWVKDLGPDRLSVRQRLSVGDLLQRSQQEVVRAVLDDFRTLFPLVILTIAEDPLPELARRLELEEDESGTLPPYTLEECAADSGFDIETLREWVRAIERKGQAVFYGPPGTGKTFMAQCIAKHLAGGGDGTIELIQFHPAYAYEDFMEGIRPDTATDGELTFERVPGRFREFCRRAQGRDGTCVLIIDEINRANLSRVFGELMYLLEYRDAHIPLAGGTRFQIPPNVRILGTMNTADRSIAMVDHALRRRFAFIPLQPSDDVLRGYHETRATGFDVEPLVQKLGELNGAIGDPHYHVGISFFMHERLEDHLEAIWRMEIEPYLEEYFFDQPDRLRSFRWAAVGETLLP
ncbi:MAG: AAA family ATPase, partial [Phycisphaerales bacterium JB038]